MADMWNGPEVALTKQGAYVWFQEVPWQLQLFKDEPRAEDWRHAGIGVAILCYCSFLFIVYLSGEGKLFWVVSFA